MGKIIVLFFLVTTYNLQSQVVMDSVIICDYHNARKMGRESGLLPIYVKIHGFDTLTLDAGDKTIKPRKLKHDGRNFILRGVLDLTAVKIYFPKDSTITIHIRGQNNFELKEFHIDTLLVINNAVPRPLTFWAMLRQKYQNSFSFNPIMYTITNEDFASKNLSKRRLKNIPPKFIRYTCNTVTKELIDLWAQ